jgi:hypothetical protein
MWLNRGFCREQTLQMCSCFVHHNICMLFNSHPTCMPCSLHICRWSIWCVAMFLLWLAYFVQHGVECNNVNTVLKSTCLLVLAQDTYSWVEGCTRQADIKQCKAVRTVLQFCKIKSVLRLQPFTMACFNQFGICLHDTGNTSTDNKCLENRQFQVLRHQTSDRSGTPFNILAKRHLKLGHSRVLSTQERA